MNLFTYPFITVPTHSEWRNASANHREKLRLLFNGESQS